MAWSFQRRCLRPSGPWCFAVSQAPVKRSFWTCVSKAQKVTFDTAACGLELPMALLACLSAMVFCCFASAFRSSFGTGFIPEAWPEGTVAAFWTSFHFAVSEAPFWQETRLSPEEVVDITHELGHASGLQQEWHLTRNCRFRAAETIWN